MTNDQAPMTNVTWGRHRICGKSTLKSTRVPVPLASTCGPVLDIRLGRHDHSEPVLCFSCFAPTDTDPIPEFFLCTCLICFDVIGSNARRRSYQLAFQRGGYWIVPNKGCKSNDFLTKQGRAFSQIETPILAAFFGHWSFRLFRLPPVVPADASLSSCALRARACNRSA